ncbi:MAG: hypothetical protein MUE68_06420 [Bacteroidetes bacterium]|nr:hypothetical protein [Bacteroidota bacterium]
MERFRRSPIDLRTATVEELLQVPGVHRREAAIIVQAVRSGKIAEWRSVDLLHGVRPGTVERLIPYVTLGASVPSNPVTTHVRSQATVKRERGHTEFVRERVDVRLEQRADIIGRDPSRWEVRRTGSPEPSWFTFARIPSPTGAWSLCIGDLNVRSGSSLLDAGRRTSVLRPSDWDRRSNEDIKVHPGYDAGAARRGLSLEMLGVERSILISMTERDNAERTAILAWSEEWFDGLETHCVRMIGSGLTAVRMSYRSPSWQIALEGAYANTTPSHTASIGRSVGRQTEIRWVLRRLRGVPAAGVPRAGGRSTLEDAFSMAVRTSPGRVMRFHLVGDVGRESDTDDHVVSWEAMSSFGVGCRAVLADRTNVGVEWAASRTGRSGSTRWTSQVRQQLSQRLMVQLSTTRRVENDFLGGRVVGRISQTSLSWKGTVLTMDLRWMRVDGDPSVGFWVMGPGPASLSGLQRLSGRSSQLQLVATGQPMHGVDFGASIAWRYGPAGAVRSSIRVEIQL